MNGGKKSLLIYGFNEACNNVAASFLKIGDNSMREIRFKTTAKGNLPHLSYIFCKPKPMGTEFKTVVFSITGALILIELKRGKEGTNNIKYQQEIGVTAVYTDITKEATKGIGQKYLKGATQAFFLIVGSPQRRRKKM